MAAMTSSSNSSNARRSLFPVLAILFLACALRSVQYFARTSFWFDELDMVANFEHRSLTELVSRPLGEMQVAPAGSPFPAEAGARIPRFFRTWEWSGCLLPPH